MFYYLGFCLGKRLLREKDQCILEVEVLSGDLRMTEESTQENSLDGLFISDCFINTNSLIKISPRVQARTTGDSIV